MNRWERGHNEPQPDRLMRIREMHAEYLARINSTNTVARGAEKTPPVDFEGDPEAIKLLVWNEGHNCRVGIPWVDP